MDKKTARFAVPVDRAAMVENSRKAAKHAALCLSVLFLHGRTAAGRRLLLRCFYGLPALFAVISSLLGCRHGGVSEKIWGIFNTGDQAACKLHSHGNLPIKIGRIARDLGGTSRSPRARADGPSCKPPDRDGAIEPDAIADSTERKSASAQNLHNGAVGV
jgi:hypothetical protein